MAVAWFYLSVLALFSLGMMCILFTTYWMWSWHGGFAWNGTQLTFNYHPVLMVAGMVVFYSAGEYEVSRGDVPRPRPEQGRALPLHVWLLSLLVQGYRG